MPELPEVETITRQLKMVLPWKRIIRVEGVTEAVVGKTIVAIERKQKIIAVNLSDGEVLLIHLKMTGQLIFDGNESERIVGGHPTPDWAGKLPSKHTRATIHFEHGERLFFNDQRKFGWIRLEKGNFWRKKKQSMPPDVIDEAFTKDYLEEILRKSTRAIKLVILDQAKIGGMGNIYANDALYMAKIHPNMPANQLKSDAVIRLFQAMKYVINKGIETGGASYSHYVGIEGLGGHYQEHFLVYDREGEVCRICGGEIIKIKLGGRGTYYCVGCQKE